MWTGDFLQQFVGDSRASVICIDNAATGETVLLDQMLHWFIILMGIDTNVTA